MSRSRRAFHTQISEKPPRRLLSFADLVEGQRLWYTTHADPEQPGFWYMMWPNAARDAGEYFVRYAFDIPEVALTTDIAQPQPQHILVLTRENAISFARRYTTLQSGFGRRVVRWDALQRDFAGVDANDTDLWRFAAFQAVNNGPPSGAVWRFGSPVHFQLAVDADNLPRRKKRNQKSNRTTATSKGG